MEIFKLEDYKKTRKLVYLDEGTPAFCLYNKEISQFELKEGMELTDEAYAEILGILSKRARERALYLLDDMPRTERQLRDKLRDGYYPEEAIDYAIDYCRGKHYIDDLDYAMRYIDSKSATLSRRMIEQKLYMKGIDKDTIAEALDENEPDDRDAIKALISKKYGDISSQSHDDRQKLIRRLMSKGFSYDNVKQILDEYGLPGKD